MFRIMRRGFLQKHISVILPKQTFLTNEYKCLDAWNAQISSPLLEKLNLHEFYNILDQNFTSKGVISAIDVDMFANAVKDPSYMEELRDLLNKLRLSAETGNTLDSTHHATIRKYIEYGDMQELVNILRDPLNFGLFMDFYTANILLDKLITSQNYNLAAEVASVIMLQEDFSNEITCSLCQYAAYKYLTTMEPPVEQPPVQDNKKVEVKKIRIKFLRNEYFDDHFDIKDLSLLSGKTLALISKHINDNMSNNLQIIGWLYYKKYDKLIETCKLMSKATSFKLYKEVIEIITKESSKADDDNKTILENCTAILTKTPMVDVSLEESIKISIENAINKVQNKDILSQKELFNSWVKIREEKLEEQAKRLDRAKRMKLVELKQKEMKEQEQKLWFFENEEEIDLEIENKSKLEDASAQNDQKKADETYIPPEILPKRR
ncbi:uncharacterized protein [Epargyreus clarus]|uniref:uncharacterized protein n=1 Tax=Epargyreus clarus TaxID=520877 RepID=UPI003C2B8223